MQAPRQRLDAERLEVERASERASEQLGDAMHALREAVLATSRAGQWTASLDSELCDRIIAFFAEAVAVAPRKNCTKKLPMAPCAGHWNQHTIGSKIIKEHIMGPLGGEPVLCNYVLCCAMLCKLFYATLHHAICSSLSGARVLCHAVICYSLVDTGARARR